MNKPNGFHVEPVQGTTGEFMEQERGQHPQRGGAPSGRGGGMDGRPRSSGRMQSVMSRGGRFGAQSRSFGPGAGTRSGGRPGSGFGRIAGAAAVGRRPGFRRGRWSRLWPRWGWLSPPPGGFPDRALGPAEVAQAQACLAQLFGPWVPQSGALGPATRRAIRIFQKQQGMGPSGVLDPATNDALTAACGQSAPAAAAPPAAPPDAPPPPEDAAPAGAAPGPDAAPPEGAPEPGGEDTTAGEVSFAYPFRKRFDTTEREFIVTVQQPCAVTLRRYHPVPINGRTGPEWKRPGAYIIYDAGKEWYVGVGTIAINNRFHDRLKVLRDFNISPDSLRNITVSAVSLENFTPNCVIVQSRARGSASTAGDPRDAVAGILQVAEQHLISRYRTNLGRGNGKGDPVWLRGPGQLTVRIIGPNGQIESETVLASRQGDSRPVIESRRNRG